MKQRWIQSELLKRLDFSPAVALLGTRQVGKTTLAYEISNQRDSIYLDLESPKDLSKLSDAESYFLQHCDKLIILDEIQRAPELFSILRSVIDHNIRHGKQTGQFLILGSASMDLLRQSSESLAGRITYLEMTGFNGLEVPYQTTQDINKLWFRGGYPRSYLAKNDTQSQLWVEDLIRTYLERDIPSFGFRVSATRLRRLWTMLSHLQGEVVNYSTLASNLEVDGKTVSKYIDILVDLLLVRRLEPWHSNVKKRLIKSPRFYVRDSGILHCLLSIPEYESLLSNPILGKSWEGFVMENIMSIIPAHIKPYFYRTSAGAEIDLVLKISNNEIWAIEIKTGLSPKISKGFYSSCEDINATQRFVVYGGLEQYPIKNRVTMISLLGIMNKLLKIL